MDLIMPTQDFLNQVLEMMDKRMDELKDDIRANTKTTNKVLEQAQKTNGRVLKAEADIKDLQKRSGRKLNLAPNVIYLLALAFVLLLFIIARILHVDIKGLL